MVVKGRDIFAIENNRAELAFAGSFFYFIRKVLYGSYKKHK